MKNQLEIDFLENITEAGLSGTILSFPAEKLETVTGMIQTFSLVPPTPSLPVVGRDLFRQHAETLVKT